MARQGFSLLLQFYLLLLLVRPLDPSSRPERDTGTSGQLPEEMELQDTDPEPTLMVDVVLALWTCLLVVLLITGIVLGCGLGRRFWRCWTEVREGGRHSRKVLAAEIAQGLGTMGCRPGPRATVDEPGWAGPEAAGPLWQPFGPGAVAQAGLRPWA